MADDSTPTPARAPRKRAATKAPKLPEFQLTTQKCPMVCEAGEVPVFDPATGLWGRGPCVRCMGTGEVEVQRV